jgi:hypothetical protein
MPPKNIITYPKKNTITQLKDREYGNDTEIKKINNAKTIIQKTIMPHIEIFRDINRDRDYFQSLTPAQRQAIRNNITFIN